MLLPLPLPLLLLLLLLQVRWYCVWVAAAQTS
jgi:hypothetical protein